MTRFILFVLAVVFFPVWLLGFVLGFLFRPLFEGLLRGFYLLLIVQETFVQKAAQEAYNDILSEEQEQLRQHQLEFQKAHGQQGSEQFVD